MKTAEYMKWFHENLVRGEKNFELGIYNYTIDGYSFTTKLTKAGYLSLYDTTNGKVCIATRIYDDTMAIEDSIYAYLYKKLGNTRA